MSKSLTNLVAILPGDPSSERREGMNGRIVALGFPGIHKSVVIMRADDEPVPYLVGGRIPTLEPIEHNVRHVLKCMFGWDGHSWLL